MTNAPTPFAFPVLPRLRTHVPGLDVVLGGGFLAGDAYLIVGEPGSGKTTLGNQLAFAHAAAGGTAMVATLATESHDRMLAHLQGFAFADPSVVGTRLTYFSFLSALETGGAAGIIDPLWKAIRSSGATLIVIDGATVPSGFDAGLFIHGLQSRSALAGCTTILLASTDEETKAAGHVDGVIELTNETVGSRDARWVRVAKHRGSTSLSGRHRFTIGPDGVIVSPRLEAAGADLEPAIATDWQRVSVGVNGLDTMLAGGLPSGTATLVLGTPGAGKTLLGLHFLTEGARRGEPGLLAAFSETPAALATTAERIGLEFRAHWESGLVRVLWQPPLEGSPDEWAWDLLELIDRHQIRRLVVDALTDLAALFVRPGRQSRFASALANQLRDRQVTTIFTMEIDAFAGPELAAPIPNVSATMDNGILLRSVELRSELHRLVSILKLRQSPFDHAIRQFTIGDGGISVGEPLAGSRLLTGSAIPEDAK